MCPKLAVEELQDAQLPLRPAEPRNAQEPTDAEGVAREVHLKTNRLLKKAQCLKKVGCWNWKFKTLNDIRKKHCHLV